MDVGMETKKKEQDDESTALSTKLRQVQAVTGLIIAVFTSAHLVNHFGMHFGLETHKLLFRKFRRIYTNPIVEMALLVSIFVHSAVAIYKYNGVPKDWSKRLFQASGAYLLLTMPGHITATRYFGPLAGMAEYDITYAAMAARLFPLGFVPYYAIMAASGAIHMLGGIGKSASILNIKPLTSVPSRGKRFFTWSAILGACAVSSAFAVCGIYFRYEMADEVLLRKKHLSLWPRFIVRHLRVPTDNSWFAGISL